MARGMKSRRKKTRSLSRKMLGQFAICLALLLLLATPLFYGLTKHYYAEDMQDLVETVKQGDPLPASDLEEDILHGIMIQFGLMTLVLALAMVLTLRFISWRLWKPFDKTLRWMETFRLEDGCVTVFSESHVAEFDRLNRALLLLIHNSLVSYRMQKEFTENAWHELQTPLAVFQSKLDLLLQLPGLTARQAELVRGLYENANRLARLNRNLLLLAKIDNRQYQTMEEVDLPELVGDLLPSLESLSGSVSIYKDFQVSDLKLRANRTLLESLVNNLVVNAVRHNRPDGMVMVHIIGRQLEVVNTSDEPALNKNLIFRRFYRSSEATKGSGLGLAIVKAVCDYHGWKVSYCYEYGFHSFIVDFGEAH